MNRHALDVLEFDRALEVVAGLAASAQGREAIRALGPGTDGARIARELGRVRETILFLEEKPGWGPPPVPGVEASLERLGVRGGVLEAAELHRVHVLLSSSRALGDELDRREGDHPALGPLRELLHRDEAAEEALGRAVDPEGEVLDSASRELRRIRSELKRAHARIVKKLESYVRTLPERVAVADASISIRDGRYVVAIRREGKSEVGGVVHGESGSGQTLFVEPPIALQLMNDLKELEQEEQREIRRILRELSDRLAPSADALAGALAALVDFDTLHARARAAGRWGGEVPELLDDAEGGFAVVRGRHPLLLEREDEVVPFDVAFEPGERVMVVSGPNTGGKSVFLKAMGLIAALAQSGVVPPAARGTRLPVFRAFFADIGDEQSIAESLSTFSAHLANLKEIVEGADDRSLVLIDEMGTGTDPAEGAALARAILEVLVERGALAVVTSHLGALKTLDAEGSGIVNASLQFDPDRMEPTYQLVKGRPGRSYGLAIARRLGFPADVLDRADGHISEGEASVEDLLEKLERKEKEATGLVEALERERAEAARLRAEAESRAREVGERERTAERRARDEARELLMEARREVEEAILEVRVAGEEGEDLEEAGRRARRRVEEAARRQEERKPGSPDRGRAPESLEVGRRVRVGASGTKGRVVEIRSGKAVLDASGLRMEVPVGDLVVLEDAPGDDGSDGGKPAGGATSSGWTGPETDPSSEVDLRGLRVDEVELELGRALDGAVLGGLGEVRIIHGKGTGAVRSRVQELLGREKRVADFRLGRPGEGGAGVTVAILR